MSIGWQMEKHIVMSYIFPMKYYSAIRRNRLLIDKSNDMDESQNPYKQKVKKARQKELEFV